MQFTLLGLCVVIPHRHLCSGVPFVLVEKFNSVLNNEKRGIVLGSRYSMKNACATYLLAFLFSYSKAFGTFQPGAQQKVIISS